MLAILLPLALTISDTTCQICDIMYTQLLYFRLYDKSRNDISSGLEEICGMMEPDSSNECLGILNSLMERYLDFDDSRMTIQEVCYNLSFCNTTGPKEMTMVDLVNKHINKLWGNHDQLLERGKDYIEKSAVKPIKQMKRNIAKADQSIRRIKQKFFQVLTDLEGGDKPLRTIHKVPESEQEDDEVVSI